MEDRDKWVRPGLDYHTFPQRDGETPEDWWNRYLAAVAEYDLMSKLRKR